MNENTVIDAEVREIPRGEDSKPPDVVVKLPPQPTEGPSTRDRLSVWAKGIGSKVGDRVKEKVTDLRTGMSAEDRARWEKARETVRKRKLEERAKTPEQLEALRRRLEAEQVAKNAKNGVSEGSSDTDYSRYTDDPDVIDTLKGWEEDRELLEEERLRKVEADIAELDRNMKARGFRPRGGK